MPTTYAIPNGRTVFNSVIWTGTNSSGNRSITGVGFQPDFVWTKSRSQPYENVLYDAVRGAGSTKELSSNNTNAEGGGNEDLYGYLASFDSDGFTGNAGSASQNLYFNELNQTYVAWNWKANGAGSSNTNGSITSTVSVNTTAGFSVVTYTGTGSNATVGHGLGVAPSFMIFKQRSGSGTSWQIYHASLGATQALDFTTGTAASTINYWNNTAPTSTVATIGISYGVNQSSQTYVGYCWSEVAGFSKFGSYTGNGSTDGPFVYTGFRPKFVLIKIYSVDTGSWRIYDTSRNTYNLVDNKLYPDTSGAENSNGGETSATNDIDILSNGFKLRTSNTGTNVSGDGYIYACFAENPFKYANAR